MTDKPLPQTLRAGMHLDVTCERLNAAGFGVAPVGAFDVQVAQALPTARLRVCVDHVSPHHRPDQRPQAWAHVVQITQASRHEQAPFCPAFGACGGCTWQHLAYEQQLHWKRELVAEALRPANLPQLVAACEASPVVRGYRNQAKYVVQALPAGLRLGGYAPRSHRVVDLVECMLVEPAIATNVSSLQSLLLPVGQDLRHIVIRANHQQQTLVTLVFGSHAKARSPAAQACAQQILQACLGTVGVVANVNESPGDVIFGDHEFALAGEAFIGDVILGARVRLSPRAFFQVNRHVAALAYAQIAAFASTLGAVQHLWDAYAGVGTIARVLCRTIPDLQTALCVEIRSSAVADAKAAVADTTEDEARLRFVAADAAVGIDPSGPQPDLVVLNPPRAGCHASVLSQVAAAGPKGVAYLSCNPVTLARDLVRLAELGFAVKHVQPFDMLPHTPHVETLALLVPG